MLLISMALCIMLLAISSVSAMDMDDNATVESPSVDVETTIENADVIQDVNLQIRIC